jgi:hypothetical protein
MAKPRDLDQLDPLHRLWFLILAQGDFGQSAKAARIALTTLKNDSSGDGRFTYDSLAECAVTRYARPFGRCMLPQPRAAGQPKPPQISTRLPVSFVERAGLPGATTVHEAAIRLRDSFYAHSDAHEKGMRLNIVDGGGYPALQAGAGTQSVAPENLALLERLSRTLASTLAPEIGLLANKLLPQLHPAGSLEIGQSVSIRFEPGVD